jgi:translocation protein SEC62
MQQTPEDIKQKKIAKKERKAAKLAAKANGEGKPSKNKKGFPSLEHQHQHGHVEEIVEEEQPQQPPIAANSAPQPTGSEAAPAATGDVTQRPPRATVEEAEDE